MDKIIKSVYEYCKDSNNSSLEKEIDLFVKNNGLYNKDSIINENQKRDISLILDKHGILNEGCNIIKVKNYIKESKDILPYLKKCGKISKKLYENVLNIIEGYSIPFSDKTIIDKSNLVKLNESLSYLEHVNKAKAINESLDDLSNLPISEGNFDFDNYQDFLSTFDEKWLSKNEEKLSDLELWFNNGGSVTMNIFSDSNSLTGFSTTLSWSNGESVIQNHGSINSLVKKYIEDDIADSFVNEAETPEDDDFDMKEYQLDGNELVPGTYQIIESDHDDFMEFDLIEIISSNGKTVKMKDTAGKDKEIASEELKGITAVLYKDYDLILECIENETVLAEGGITFNDMKSLIKNNGISYEEIENLLSDMVTNQTTIGSMDNQLISCDGEKFYKENVDNFGNTEIFEIGREEVMTYIIFQLIAEKQLNNPTPADFGYDCKYDTNAIYSKAIVDERLQGEMLSDFIEKWNGIILKFVDAGDPFSDSAVEEILDMFGIRDLAMVNVDGNGQPKPENQIPIYSQDEIVQFLCSQFEGISRSELEGKITTEKAEEFSNLQVEFYGKEENLENDESVADRYVDFLLDFIKSCGISISLYR